MEFRIQDFSEFSFEGTPVVIGCCVCGKIHANDATWHELKESIRQSVRISHTYCPACYKKAKEAIVR